MGINENALYSSFINNISYTKKSSNEWIEINSKGIDSVSFATQLKNAQKTDTYLNEIKSYVPNTIVTIKSMTAGDVRKYYEEWKKQAVDYSEFKHNIIISPKVLEKMGIDPKYAEQMLLKIKKASIPEGFGNATIYEYKVIVRDDGEIETLACADFMNGKNQKIDTDNEDKKDEKEKVGLTYSHKGAYNQWESRTLFEEEIKTTYFNEPQYLFHIADANRVRDRNKVID